ncbi:TlpA disulfide reductase family protein [Dyadobacter sp. CY312]|uniref:TlpA disulfide reductase family protein n=1 Tax=Dyadobacter sp. CY312 TaxID=2907303 RepID=UPI001F35F4D5|nr:TlpA disulfide reductase family protein [Dyadobacter sp. CY312]MCE7039013.1 AhpC/TSA family protein [Dyadobacter sp. CY312]
MLRNILVCIISMFPIMVSGQTKPYKIVGQINDAKAIKVFLFVADIITNTNMTDSAEVVNGHFEFIGKVGAPLKAILFAYHNNSRLHFFVEQGTTIVNSADSLDNAQITAGRINKDFVELRRLTDAVDARRRKASARHEATLANYPEKEKDQEFMAKRNLESDSFVTEKNRIYETFARDRTNNMAAIYALASVAGTKTDVYAIRPQFARMSESVRKSPYGLIYAEKLRMLSRLVIGNQAPAFTQPDTAGNAVALKDFKGKYVLLDFWASWCKPCREEHPNLLRAYNEFNTKNFTILSVSLDSPNAKSAWLKAIAKDGLLWTQLSDLKGWKNEAGQLYSVEAVPSNFLIDPYGKIVAKDLRGNELNLKLAELLGK